MQDHTEVDQDVVPIPSFDHIWAVGRQQTISYCFVFDGQLDPTELRLALYQLAERKYRLLGARLKKNVQVSRTFSWTYKIL